MGKHKKKNKVDYSSINTFDDLISLSISVPHRGIAVESESIDGAHLLTSGGKMSYTCSTSSGVIEFIDEHRHHYVLPIFDNFSNVMEALGFKRDDSCSLQPLSSHWALPIEKKTRKRWKKLCKKAFRQY